MKTLCCGTPHGLSAAHGLPLRSHNSLLYNCHQQHALAAPWGRPSKGMPATAIPLFSPRSRDCIQWAAPLSVLLLQNACRRPLLDQLVFNRVHGESDAFTGPLGGTVFRLSGGQMQFDRKWR
jgi:hypothetical protein